MKTTKEKAEKQRYYSTQKPYATRKRRRWLYRFIYFVGVRVFPKHKVLWKEPPSSEECAIYTVNHADAYGPVAMVTNFPLSFRPWVISDVCYIRSFPAFARSDFWHPKTWLGRAWWWLVSYLLAPLGAYLFSSVEAIPAYFDKRASITIRKSEETLEEGKNIVIFPENRTPFSPYNEDFSSGFIFTARRYYHKTGKRLLFYPVFCCKEQRVISVGKPIRYDPDQDFTSQSEEIKNYLRDAMTGLALELDALPHYDMSAYDRASASEI